MASESEWAWEPYRCQECEKVMAVRTYREPPEITYLCKRCEKPTKMLILGKKPVAD